MRRVIGGDLKLVGGIRDAAMTIRRNEGRVAAIGCRGFLAKRYAAHWKRGRARDDRRRAAMVRHYG